jgi:hypothetical protein
MATSGFRPATLLLSILAAAVIGFLAHASGALDSIFTPKGIRAIVVGPRPDQLNYKDLKISKGDGDVIFWVAKTKTDKLRIEFDEEIFDDMTQSGAKWVVDCKNRSCYSHDVKADFVYKEGTQILIDAAGEHPYDGHIIIEK